MAESEERPSALDPVLSLTMARVNGLREGGSYFVLKK
jgi:hypothetical protein